MSTKQLKCSLPIHSFRYLFNEDITMTQESIVDKT